MSWNIAKPGDQINGPVAVTGDLNVDSNTLFVDSANNRVGVLTASPTVPLDVVGDAKISGNLIVDTNTLVVDAANNRLGIGTATPATFGRLAISVSGTGESKSSIGISNNGNYGTVASPKEIPIIEMFSGAGTLPVGVYSLNTFTDTVSHWLAFKTNGTDGSNTRMTIASDGVCTWSNVGGVAGTAMTLNGTGLGVGVSPSYKLDVNGAIVASSSHPNISGNLNSLNKNISTVGYNLTNSPSGTGWAFVNTQTNGLSSGDIYWQFAYDTYQTAKMYTRHTTDSGATWSSWKTILNSDSVSGTTNYVPKFTASNTLGNSAIVESSGNVGIGTSTPTAKLDVAGGGKISGDFNVDSDTLIVNSSTNRVGINLNGIGAPQSPLHVFLPEFQRLIVQGYYTAGDSKSGILFGDSQSSQRAGIDVGIMAGGGGYLQFMTAQSNNVLTLVERLRIRTDGVFVWQNVGGNAGNAMVLDGTGLGIGVSTPSGKLHVEGANIILKNGTGVPFFQIAGRNTDGRAEFNFLNNGLSVNNAKLVGYTNTLAFEVAGSERVRIDASGNLFVGASSQNVWTTILTVSKDSGTTKWAIGPWNTDPDKFIISASASAGVYLNSTNATSWSAISDERYKDIIEPILNALEKVNSLRSVIGKLKSDEKHTRKSFLIAQDVQAVLPEAVDNSNPDRLGLSYTDVIPLIVAAIKELTARVQTLENA